jgi:hypothetical protein
VLCLLARTEDSALVDCVFVGRMPSSWPQGQFEKSQGDWQFGCAQDSEINKFPNGAQTLAAPSIGGGECHRDVNLLRLLSLIEFCLSIFGAEAWRNPGACVETRHRNSIFDPE